MARGDSWVSGLIPLLVVAVLVGWGVWFFKARISRYEISEEARVEVDAAVYPIESQMSGKVIRTDLRLGQKVRAGQVLVELDAESERLRLVEARARLDSIEPEIETLRKELDAEARARKTSDQAGETAIVEAKSRYKEADAMARYAEQKASRQSGLDKIGAITELDIRLAEADAVRQRAAAESAGLSIDRLDWERQTESSDRQVRVASLTSEIGRLLGEVEVTKAAIMRLDHEIQIRQIRAPVDGVLAEVSEIKVGSVILEDEKLAQVVPEGVLRIVARFTPRAAIGRIHPGQAARMRMYGFPWTQYGMLSAEVERVGGEVRDGRVRVDLSIPDHEKSPIPLQHGLPGTVEIEVERVSPAAIALRAAGRLLSVSLESKNISVPAQGEPSK
jgi:membrane fusion protein (multidrug efflux system)